MESNYYIAQLIHKFNTNILAEEEQKSLDNWLNESEANREVFDRATNSQQLLDKLEIYELFDKKKAWSDLSIHIDGPKIIPIIRSNWYRFAAAIVIPLVAIGSVWYITKKQPEPSTLTTIDKVIKPGTQKATLILANGNNVDLEGDNVPSVISQRDAEITNKENKLTYVAKETIVDVHQPLEFNELQIPKGGTYSLTLSDGSLVTLNAASSLRFPVSFADSIRQVLLAGEAYFEVMPGVKPFIVTSSHQDVRVLGTKFNIAAYSDDEVVTTTLVEGKVLVSGADPGSIIHMSPNDKVTFSKKDASMNVSTVNTDKFISWTRGKFEFESQSLDQVMKQLARWYDFEYRFERDEAMNYHFSGRIENTENISTILEMLQLTTDVHFEYSDETIVIL